MLLTSLGSVWLKGPGSQSTVIMRCHRRQASFWLCLPHLAPRLCLPYPEKASVVLCVTSCGAQGPGPRSVLQGFPGCQTSRNTDVASDVWHRHKGAQ